MTDFEPPQRLAAFLKWNIHGKRNTTLCETKDKQVKNSQHIISANKTDRQMGYKYSAHAGVRVTTETPMSMGFALTAYKITRKKSMVEHFHIMNL